MLDGDQAKSLLTPKIWEGGKMDYYENIANERWLSVGTKVTIFDKIYLFFK